MSVICPSCSFENKVANPLFCLKCGGIIGGEKYQNQALIQEYSEKIKHFLSDLEKKSKDIFSSYTPLPQLKGVFEKVSEIEGILELYHSQDSSNKTLERYIGECKKFLSRDNSFQIAFAGTIKAGKSTLINAMLKKEYASMSVTPETAVLTKFRYGSTPQMKVSFYNQKEWEELWESATNAGGLFIEEFEKLNARPHISQWVGKEPITEELSAENLKKYTSSREVAHYFAKEVEISFPDFPYDKNIVFVDTPGLDDAVDYRSKVTRDYINRANAVLVCVECTTLTNNELNTIIRIFDNTGGHPEKVYILATKYENFNSPAKDWAKQKEEWMKYLKSNRENEKVGYNADLAEKNIIEVSGYVSLLCDLYKDGLISDEQTRHLRATAFKLFDDPDIQSNLEKLRSFANVEKVHQRIREDILDKAQEAIIEDTKTQANNLLKEIEKHFKESKDGLQESYDVSQKGIEAINEKIQKENQKIEEVKQSQEELKAMLKEFDAEAKKAMDLLNNEIDQIIGSIK